MITLRRTKIVCSTAMCLLMPTVFAMQVQAQGVGMSLPIQIATSTAIVDEFGKNLKGDARSASGDLVQILQISNGAEIVPPAIDGTPGPGNTVISQGTSRIGNQVAPSLKDAGLFCATIPQDQPPPNTRLFVRVFNASNPSEASFYGDSEVFDIRRSQNVYRVSVAATDKPLDGADADADGLNNSYEKSYGSDSNNADSDGDGVSDGAERHAGTDLMNASRRLRIESERPVAEHDLAITWQTVSGRCYQLEYTQDDLASAPVFLPVGDPVPAVADYTTMNVPDGMAHNKRYYRVWVLDPSANCQP